MTGADRRLMNIDRKKRKERKHGIIRALFYAFLLVFSFILMQTVNTDMPVALLLIPCAVCVSMREDPFVSSIYAAACGFFLDVCLDVLPGLNAIILMWTCMMVSLFTGNVLRRTFIGFVIADAAVIFIQELLHYTFYCFIWDYDPTGLMIRDIYLPEFIITNVTGLLFYPVTGLIMRRFGAVTEHYIEQ
ncbi:MAG: hypothetical protein IJ149_04130 [Oscillospiraceae bacterium]|jgi:hypothetical protein|nr:hypothetical protein [Oscillospiraceae bacterium]